MTTASTRRDPAPAQRGSAVEDALATAKLREAWWETGMQARIDAGVRGVARAMPRLLAGAMRRALRVDRVGTLASLIATVGGGLMSTLGLLTTQRVLIRIFAEGPTLGRVEGALPALVLLAVVTVIRGGLGIATGWSQTRLEPRLRQETERALFEATTGVPLSAFDADGFVDELERGAGRGVDSVWFVVRNTLDMLAGVIGVIAAGVALGVLHPLLPMALLVASVPDAWAALHAGNVRYRKYLQGSIRRRKLWILTTLMARRDSAAELRAYHLREFLLGQYDRTMGDETRDQVEIARAVTATIAVGSLVSGVATGGVYALLAWLLVAGQLPLASAVTAVVALQAARSSLHLVTMFTNEVYAEGRHLRDLDTFMTRCGDLSPSRPDHLTAAPAFHALSLERVTLTFPGRDRPAVDAVSLTILAGQTVAFVGENGSGKTTLASILTGLRTPDTGTVRWDDRPVGDLDPSTVQAQVAVVTQDHWHWPFTCEINIRLGDLARTDGPIPVHAAAQAAAAHEMIEALPHGYATLLDRDFEGGQELSGGQWQRIAAARGFFRDAPLLIMDEPSSALDAKAEAALFEAVRARHGKATTVLITHRLANVRHADVIYVMADGRLIDQGSHTELIARDGPYRTWYDLQRIGYLDQ